MKVIKIYTRYEAELQTNPAFRLVVTEAIGTPGFLDEYNRLNGIVFNLPKNGLEMLIDQATGAGESRIRQYLIELLPFIWRTIYLPLHAQQSQYSD